MPSEVLKINYEEREKKKTLLCRCEFTFKINKKALVVFFKSASFEGCKKAPLITQMRQLVVPAERRCSATHEWVELGADGIFSLTFAAIFGNLSEVFDLKKKSGEPGRVAASLRPCFSDHVLFVLVSFPSATLCVHVSQWALQTQDQRSRLKNYFRSQQGCFLLFSAEPESTFVRSRSTR